MEAATSGWHGRLALRLRRDGHRTVAHGRHEGPLRVLKSLYPEAPAICHQVIVHPPGGIVGGDALEIELALDAGAHALVTTPGATRFYRSTGRAASQRVGARLAAGARLEWLPLETIAFPGCIAANTQTFMLEPGAEMIGWDLLALGLPASGRPWERGCFDQHLEVPGTWLERGRIDAADRRLLDSPLGLDGHRVSATLWFAAGTPIDGVAREALAEAGRTAAGAFDASLPCGITSPDARMVVLRALAGRVEPALALLRAVWAAWRSAAWQIPPAPPRVWRT